MLDGVRITHTWGGAIDPCTRFGAFWERSHSGKVASVRGYTGLGAMGLASTPGLVESS